ncbi:MAG: FeoB-associated Cys-rich membrane protein [Ruminococcus sp.]|nr:FeoB-associated Cys-rich membrane protein [Ruminococcus sp.]
MKSWMIVLVILIAVIVMIIVSIIRNKLSGKPSCGRGCQNCSLHNTCHPDDNLK